MILESVIERPYYTSTASTLLIKIEIEGTNIMAQMTEMRKNLLNFL